MYRFRKGKVVEASIIGAAGRAGGDRRRVPGPGLAARAFLLALAQRTVFALAAYGFVAAVLPVWLLLCPRDYLSSFLKIGTIFLLVAA